MSETTSDPPKGPQEHDPPDLDLVVVAAQRLRAIVRDPDRPKDDKRRAIDALGRVLIRLKRDL